MLNSLYQQLDPVAFSLGPLAIRWYGIAYVVGFFLGGFILYRVAKRWKINIDTDSVLTLLICLIFGVILGARLGYVVFYGDGYYFEHPAEILAVTKGGMSFHGGLIGATIGIVVASRLVHVSFLTLADLVAIGVPLALCLGRCANFINGELWGAVSDVPWAVVFGGAAGDEARHPTQLYEAFLEGLVLFCVLYLLSRKLPPLPQGSFVGVFLLGYGVFRFLIEFVRQPDSQLGYLWGDWLTMGQVLSVPLIIAGVGFLAYAMIKRQPQQGPHSA